MTDANLKKSTIKMHSKWNLPVDTAASTNEFFFVFLLYKHSIYKTSKENLVLILHFSVKCHKKEKSSVYAIVFIKSEPYQSRYKIYIFQ